MLAARHDDDDDDDVCIILHVFFISLTIVLTFHWCFS